MDWCFYSFSILMLLHRCCCLSLNVASTCNSPVKMNHFYCRSLQLVTKQGVSHTLKPLIFLTPFDVFTPPLMLPVLLWCCCSLFYVAIPALMLPLHLEVAIPPFKLTFFFDVPATHLCYCSPIEVASPPSMSLNIWIQDPVSGIKDKEPGIQDDQSVSCILFI